MILEIKDAYGSCSSVVVIKTDDGNMSHQCSQAASHQGMHSTVYHLNGVFLRVEWRQEKIG